MKLVSRLSSLSMDHDGDALLDTGAMLNCLEAEDCDLAHGKLGGPSLTI
jgi:hypothetical protein